MNASKAKHPLQYYERQWYYSYGELSDESGLRLKYTFDPFELLVICCRQDTSMFMNLHHFLKYSISFYFCTAIVSLAEALLTFFSQHVSSALSGSTEDPDKVLMWWCITLFSVHNEQNQFDVILWLIGLTDDIDCCMFPIVFEILDMAVWLYGINDILF